VNRIELICAALHCERCGAPPTIAPRSLEGGERAYSGSPPEEPEYAAKPKSSAGANLPVLAVAPRRLQAFQASENESPVSP
jgi:hypothetical protein